MITDMPVPNGKSSGKTLSADEIIFAGQLNQPERLKAIQHSMEVIPVMSDSFYRLIENDEGVLFHLNFFKEQGDGRYLHIGAGIEKLTGIKRSEFNQRTFRSIITDITSADSQVPVDYLAIQNGIRMGEISDYRVEIKIIAPGGENRWLRETSISARDEINGSVIGIIGIFHDITETKRLSDILEESKKRFEENEKLKNSFLQNISHELRTPLNAIVGFSTLICDIEDNTSRKDEFKTMISSSTDHLLEIMDNIFEISRIESGLSPAVIGDVNPQDILSRVYRAFSSRAAERSLELDCRSNGDAGSCFRTDGYKLYQVLYNLVGNAVKFTLSGKVEFGYNVNGSSLEFFVSDTGIGIQDYHKSLIFDKFYQAEESSTRRFPGVGLGLSIAKANIEKLGGTLHFDSEPGKGSTFSFSIPDCLK